MLGAALSIGKGVLGMSKGSMIKLVIIAAIVAAVLGFVQYQLNTYYNNGYADAVVEQQKQADKSRKKQAKIDAAALVVLAVKFNDAKIDAEAMRAEAARLQAELDKPPEVTPLDIFEATSAPDCATMCDANFVLWRDITRTPDGIPQR